ncbi:invasion associated locus B family protein [Aureimonas pseudogalii]|uniref:Invasion protein IalB n=1 Tax=Aureimonas pseudogalii TaxID=1744844 RepID=A0A7W6MMK3_9HYPH|nr:invasion associated locus B family protein [Aureimonas pseudogalii]MBB4000889.1 invasion protein IalB [Aureimonas pseudogalii]
MPSTPRILAQAVLLAAGLIGPLGQYATAQDATALPGGASSLTEAHGDWTVACQVAPASAAQPARKVCALSQRQVNQQGQMVFAAELGPSGEGGATGLLILPFGVAVRDGVIVKIDDVQMGEPLAFSTCLPAGCIVPLDLDADTVAKLTGGKAGIITAPTVEGAPIELSLSLNGLGGAMARVTELEGIGR